MNVMAELYPETILLGPPPSFSQTINADKGAYLTEDLVGQIDLEDSQPIKDNPIRNLMELPVNNFLKTFREIEAEFYFVFNSIKTVITEIPDNLDSFGRMMKKTETSFHLHTSGLEISGHMEENY